MFLCVERVYLIHADTRDMRKRDEKKMSKFIFGYSNLEIVRRNKTTHIMKCPRVYTQNQCTSSMPFQFVICFFSAFFRSVFPLGEMTSMFCFHTCCCLLVFYSSFSYFCFFFPVNFVSDRIYSLPSLIFFLGFEVSRSFLLAV